jgi:hypothetical protein
MLMERTLFISLRLFVTPSVFVTHATKMLQQLPKYFPILGTYYTYYNSYMLIMNTLLAKFTYDCGRLIKRFAILNIMLIKTAQKLSVTVSIMTG